MSDPRDPVQDLKQIAFLLERAGEATYRVRAFRGAAAALEGREDIAELAHAGTLTRLKGVGDVTARCVVESLAGDKPGYLQRWENEPKAQLPDGGAIRQLLKGDCHTHSDWSDGGSPIEEMARAGKALGHDYMVLTDHSPRLTIANGLSPERLRRQLDVVAEVNEALAPFRLLTGIEVDILEDGSLDQEDELLAELDLVVASVHYKLRMNADEMTERMLTAVRNPHVNVLGHCTGRLVVGKGRPESTFDADEVFVACAENDVAVELNSRPERLDPPKRLLRKAIEAGCLFAIDSDAHAPGQLAWQVYGCARALECDLPPERIVNTWQADVLVDWAAR